MSVPSFAAVHRLMLLTTASWANLRYALYQMQDQLLQQKCSFLTLPPSELAETRGDHLGLFTLETCCRAAKSRIMELKERGNLQP